MNSHNVHAYYILQPQPVSSSCKKLYFEPFAVYFCVTLQKVQHTNLHIYMLLDLESLLPHKAIALILMNLQGSRRRKFLCAAVVDHAAESVVLCFAPAVSDVCSTISFQGEAEKLMSVIIQCIVILFSQMIFKHSLDKIIQK